MRHRLRRTDGRVWFKMRHKKVSYSVKQILMTPIQRNPGAGSSTPPAPPPPPEQKTFGINYKRWEASSFITDVTTTAIIIKRRRPKCKEKCSARGETRLDANCAYQRHCAFYDRILGVLRGFEYSVSFEKVSQSWLNSPHISTPTPSQRTRFGKARTRAWSHTHPHSRTHAHTQTHLLPYQWTRDKGEIFLLSHVFLRHCQAQIELPPKNHVYCITGMNDLLCLNFIAGVSLIFLFRGPIKFFYPSKSKLRRRSEEKKI